MSSLLGVGAAAPKAARAGRRHINADGRILKGCFGKVGRGWMVLEKGQGAPCREELKCCLFLLDRWCGWINY